MQAGNLVKLLLVQLQFERLQNNCNTNCIRLGSLVEKLILLSMEIPKTNYKALLKRNCQLKCRSLLRKLAL
jgi:hypothetical protein